MTVRLSMSSFAGTARTLVAVGTSRLDSMFCATRACGPLIGVVDASPLTFFADGFEAGSRGVWGPRGDSETRVTGGAGAAGAGGVVGGDVTDARSGGVADAGAGGVAGAAGGADAAAEAGCGAGVAAPLSALRAAVRAVPDDWSGPCGPSAGV